MASDLDVRLRLRADTAQVQSGLKGAARRLTGFGRVARGLVRPLGALGAAFGRVARSAGNPGRS